MKRVVSSTLPSPVAHPAHNGDADVLEAPSFIQVAWLGGAGHTGWVRDWPPEIRVECEEIIGALGPRCSVEIYVPNLDHAAKPINAQHFADELRQEITRVTGGQTSYRTDGDFRPAGTVGLVESTIVLKTFLPTVVNDALRLWLIELLVRFGLAADQAVVQVEIASHGYWIHTGLLRTSVDESRNAANGLSPRLLRRA